MREMTYQMVRVIDNVNKRFDDGYFGWVKFRALPQNALTVKTAFEKDLTVIRSLFIETVEENTTYTKRPESKIVLSEEVIEEIVEAPAAIAEAETVIAPVETPTTKEE